ncbi:hypothetical protein SprV_0200607000 [Sparganum proliferum]
MGAQGSDVLVKGLPEVCGKRPDSQTQAANYKKGKHEAPENSWPSHVGLYSSAYGPYPFCGGTLIAPTWVVTAAHCVVPDGYCSGIPLGVPFDYEKYGGHKLVVRVGDHNFTRRGRPAYNVPVKYVLIHPRFRLDAQIFGFDVALVKLVLSVRRSSSVDFTCLPEFGLNVEPGDSCFLAGWGLIANPPHEPLPDQPEALMELKAPVVEPSECKKKHATFENEFHFCTDLEFGPTCTGDSGSGLHYLAEDGTWVLYGVHSFSTGCKGPYSVHVRTDSVRFWIKDIVAVHN